MISCEQPAHDFGVAPNGKVIEHAFILRNGGDGALKINAIQSCCGVAATITETNLAPGAVASVSAKMSLRGLHGKQSKSIVVESNDPKHPKFELLLTGEAIRPAEIQPRLLNFGEIARNKVAEREVVLALNFPFQIEKVESTIPKFVVTHEKAADGRSYRIAVRTVPPLQPGLTSGMLRVSPDKNEYGAIDIPVVATISSDFFLTPREIVAVETSTKATPLSYRVLLHSKNNLPFKIVDVVSPRSDVRVKHSPMETSGYRLEVENIVADPELNGKNIVIKTDHQAEPEIELPIRVIRPAQPTP
ncbi:MAG: DUF1573 domain-containing protein [Verrucomicrobia bacterium]|nr:DUF1573 domain-containing protein [Verrucomicrobiota bacterium]